MNKIQFIFAKDRHDPSQIHPYFAEEAEAMRKLALSVGINPNEQAERLIYRGTMMWKETDYPNDSRYIQSWKEYISTSLLSVYYPLIEDISIPTFFVDTLDNNTIEQIKQHQWNRVFIKNDIKSLWSIDEYASVWPDRSLEYIKEKFQVFPWKGKYAIRKFIEPKTFLNEDRYWVLNGKIYHRSNNIPNVVVEAAKRLSVLGSKYYVIDALPNMIVEINPGESSDRYADNPPALFAQWFRDAFCI